MTMTPIESVSAATLARNSATAAYLTSKEAYRKGETTRDVVFAARAALESAELDLEAAVENQREADAAESARIRAEKEVTLATLSDAYTVEFAKVPDLVASIVTAKRVLDAAEQAARAQVGALQEQRDTVLHLARELGLPRPQLRAIEFETIRYQADQAGRVLPPSDDPYWAGITPRTHARATSTTEVAPPSPDDFSINPDALADDEPSEKAFS